MPRVLWARCRTAACARRAGRTGCSCRPGPRAAVRLPGAGEGPVDPRVVRVVAVVAAGQRRAAAAAGRAHGRSGRTGRGRARHPRPRGGPAHGPVLERTDAAGHRQPLPRSRHERRAGRDHHQDRARSTTRSGRSCASTRSAPPRCSAPARCSTTCARSCRAATSTSTAAAIPTGCRAIRSPWASRILLAAEAYLAMVFGRRYHDRERPLNPIAELRAGRRHPLRRRRRRDAGGSGRASARPAPDAQAA